MPIARSSASRPARKPADARALLRLSIAVALITIVLKGAAGYITHSMGLISDAAESIVNLVSAVFALAMVTVAARPADDDHPYGHHKAEYFASGFEGLLVAVAGVLIIGASAQRLFSPRGIEQVGWGLALAVISAAANAALAWVLLRAAREQSSIVLEADAKHLLSDVWTSAGVVVGVLAVHLTGWLWLDPLIAIGVALHIMIEGSKLVWRSSSGLMDSALDAQTQQLLRATLERVLAASPDGSQVRVDDLVTRCAGQRRFADLHMHVPDHWPLRRAATLRDAVEQALMDTVQGLRVSIQLLPLDMEARAVQADRKASQSDQPGGE